MAFGKDLERLRSVWPQSVRDDDRKAIRTKVVKTTGIVCGIVMMPVTVLLVWGAIEKIWPWWIIPVGQTFIIVYCIMLYMRANGGENTDIIIYREADRRGVKYVKGVTPLYHIMNRINADYNSHLWNRSFLWG